MNTPIAIVVLTKDEPDFLEKTVNSIIKRTKYPYELFIVDNCSNFDKQKVLLESYRELEAVHVILNKKNEWPSGFNRAIDVINTRRDLSSEYMVLTDGDIVVPNPINQVCWLEYLKQKMDNNVIIGKLGLALDDLEFTKGKEGFSKIYDEELSYTKGPMIGDMVIAPVDTALAIYRQDLFVMKNFKMVPGHASLVRPYYYICRTNQTYQAEHLGFKSYKRPNKEQTKEKIICFTKYAGFVDPIVLSRTSKRVRYFYKTFHHVFRAYWFFKVVFYWIVYIVPRFPRNLNAIQSGRKYKHE